METERLSAGSIIDSVASYGRAPLGMRPQKGLRALRSLEAARCSDLSLDKGAAALFGLVNKCSPEVFRRRSDLNTGLNTEH